MPIDWYKHFGEQKSIIDIHYHYKGKTGLLEESMVRCFKESKERQNVQTLSRLINDPKVKVINIYKYSPNEIISEENVQKTENE